VHLLRPFDAVYFFVEVMIMTFSGVHTTFCALFLAEMAKANDVIEMICHRCGEVYNYHPNYYYAVVAR
jgi:hypothetical protein